MLKFIFALGAYCLFLAIEVTWVNFYIKGYFVVSIESFYFVYLTMSYFVCITYTSLFVFICYLLVKMNEPTSISLDTILQNGSLKEHDANTAR
jgi:hypothetical protein